MFRTKQLIAASLIAAQTAIAVPTAARAAAPGAEVGAPPSAPAELSKPVANDAFGCERMYTLDGKEFICDSHVRRDGERLRTLYKGTPTALEELDLYQRNRARNRNTAYIGSLGLGIALGGFIAAGLFKGDSAPTGQIIRDSSVLGGLWIAFSAFLYGFSYNQDNERHLTRSVDLYNVAHPERPLVPQVKVNFGF